MSDIVYAIAGGDFESAGAAARCLKEHLKKVGANPAVVRRAMIAAYEAEMNVVIHARRGELKFRLADGQLEVEVTDEGPGISDIETALQPGFSTASRQARELGFGAGMGLPNIQTSCDEFTINSEVGEGTTLRFRINLKPVALYGTGKHSIEMEPERCHACHHCLHACPTGAIRVFQGRPHILDYLCVDCGACFSVCPQLLFRVAGVSDVLTPKSDSVLVISSPHLAQYGPCVTPEQALAEMSRLGFAEVIVTDPWDVALREAVVYSARAEGQPLPVISPACPAVVNLIEMRFPSLIPHLAACESPFSAVSAALGNRPQTWAAMCPCQHTELADDETAAVREFVAPSALRAAVMSRLAQPSACAERHQRSEWRERPSGQGPHPVMRVTGMKQVVGILESIEDGQAGDVTVVEPWACPQGCYGSPLMREEPSLARHRWLSSAHTIGGVEGSVVVRMSPYSARPGLRLDADMRKAVQKLGRIDGLARHLPGSDCGQCGAPTCGAFAEDVVLGRAHADACRRQNEPRKGTP